MPDFSCIRAGTCPSFVRMVRVPTESRNCASAIGPAEPVDEVARLGQNGDRKANWSACSASQRRQSSCAVSERSASATMTLVSTRITTAGQRPKPSVNCSSTRWERLWRPLAKLPTNSDSGRRSTSEAVEQDCAIGSTARSARSACSSSIASTSRCSRSRGHGFIVPAQP